MLEDLLEGVALIRNAYDNVLPTDHPVKCVFEGTMGFILEKDNILYIVFRGTEDFKDALTDADVIPVEVTGGKVHKGAWRRYIEFREIIKCEVANSNATEIRIYGHSLGAMLATLAADLVYPINNNVKLFLYAPPKLGNDDYVEYFSKLGIVSYSFCSKHDMVPDLPLEFHQVVEPTKIDFPSIKLTDELGNHSLANFIPALTEYYNSQTTSSKPAKTTKNNKVKK